MSTYLRWCFCGLLLGIVGLCSPVYAETPATEAKPPAPEVLYQARFDAPLGPEWGKTPPPSVQDAGAWLARLAATQKATLTLPVKGQQPWQSYELKVRFRIGHLPEKLATGQGMLLGVQLRGTGQTYTAFNVQACYVNNGTWFFNGLGLRSGGKIVEWEKSPTLAGPAVLNKGAGINTEWHTLAVRCQPQHLDILWDNVVAVAVSDSRLDFTGMTLTTADPALFTALDLGEVVVTALPASRPK